MAISEQLVIKATLDTSAIANEIGKLRSQFETLNANNAAALDIESKKAALIDARIAKELAAVERINASKEQLAAKEQARQDAQTSKQEAAAQREAARREQLAAKEQARQDAQTSKQEAAAQREAARREQLAAKEQQIAASTIAALERQKASSGVSAASGADREAARVAQEILRFKQQIAAIDAKIINPVDVANAKALASEINRLNLEKIKNDFKNADVGTRTFIGNLQDASAQLQVLAGKLNELRGSAQSAFAELDGARRKLSTISDDANGLVKELGNVAAANKFQATTAQLATAAYEVQSAGFVKNADTAKILEASLKGSVGGFSDVTTVSKATISVLNAYNLSADQAAATIDKFTAVQQSGLITVDQYASQISKVAPIAASAGVSLDQLNGFIATATASGVPVEATFSGLRQALASTIKPTKQAQEEAERLGIQFNATALRTRGLNGILADIKNSGKATGETFSTLFGSIEAVAAIQPAINDLGKLEANLKASANSAGLTEKNFNKAASSFKGFANEAQDALAQLGERINNTANFNPVIVSTRALITAFRSLPESAQNVIAVIVGLGASFVAISAAVTGLLTIVTPTVGAFNALAAAIGLNTLASKGAAIASGALAAAQALLTTPITANNIQLLIFDARLALVSAKQAIATGTTAAFAGATGLLSAAQQQLATSLALANTAALPLIATFAAIAAAAAVLAIQLKANELAETNQTLDGTQKSVDILGGSAIAAAKRTKNLTDELAGLRSEGKAASAEQVENARNLIKANEQRIRVLNAEAEALKNTKVADEGKARRDIQIKDFELAANTLKKQNQALEEQLKISSNIKKTAGETNAISEERLKKLREEAKTLQENANADRERAISRQQQDQKTVREQKTETKIETVKRTEDAQLEAIKAEGDRRKRELDAKQQIETQNLQAKFNQTENEKETSNKQKIEDLKKSAQEGRLAEERRFTEEQNRAKAEFSKKERELEDAASEARKKRDAINTEAFKSAKDAASNASELAKAKPEDRDRILRQQQEEERIRQAARQVPLQQNQTKESILSTAKGIAGSDKDPVEEARKVALAIAAIEEEQKRKQAEIDKVEDLKREEEKRKREEEFTAQQQLKKQEFDDGQKKAEVEFLQKTIQPIETEFANQKKQRELEFQQGALAELKRKQLAEDDALKAEQLQKEKETRLAFEEEIKKIKDEAKQQELIIDRANEDAKIARERAFKAEQRALDEASAVKILQILGQAKNNIVPTTKPPEPTGTDGGGIVDSLANSILNRVPRFETGVSGFAGGLAVVGENGAELVSLPRGANVIPNNRLASLSPIDNRTVTPSASNTKRMELLLEKLIGSVDRPNLTIETSKDPVSAAADFYQSMAASKARRMGL